MPSSSHSHRDGGNCPETSSSAREAFAASLGDAIQGAGLSLPAYLFLSLLYPLSFLLSQLCLFVEPFMSSNGPAHDKLRGAFDLLQDRDAMADLMDRLYRAEEGGG